MCQVWCYWHAQWAVWLNFVCWLNVMLTHQSVKADLYQQSICLFQVKSSKFLGTFAKLWGANVSFIMSVCPSVHME
jgi:hypothetical protein